MIQVHQNREQGVFKFRASSVFCVECSCHGCLVAITAKSALYDSVRVIAVGERPIMIGLEA